MNPENGAVFDLLSQVKEGSEAAMRQIYLTYGKSVFAFALGRLRDRSKAEEIVVDTMWEVWKKPEAFRGESSFISWVLGIARHKILDTFRVRGPEFVELEETIADETPGAPDQVFLAQQRAWVKHCIDTLPDEQRECLMLALYENMSIAELAQLQGVPQNTVKTRSFYARQKFKQCIKAIMEGN